jgi:hypothetical protein
MIVMPTNLGYELDGAMKQIDLKWCIGKTQTYTAMAKTVISTTLRWQLMVFNGKITTSKGKPLSVKK